LLRDGGLTLNPSLFWVDTWALEQRMDEIESRLRDPRSDASDVAPLIDAALSIYRGPFLPDESDPPVYIGFREHVRGRLLRCVSAVAARLPKSGGDELAIDSYTRLIDRDLLYEPAHRKLMECFLTRGARADGIAVYERLRALLASKLRTYPSPETQAVYTKLRGTAPD
jgi:DNA-binding SARP family transcriptional activator